MFSLAPTCTTTITTLEPCALNAEFHDFIPKFNKNFLTLRIPLKEGLKQRVTLGVTLIVIKGNKATLVMFIG
jgi:hypothetical protein